MFCPNKMFEKNGHTCEMMADLDPISQHIPGDSLWCIFKRFWLRIRLISELSPQALQLLKSQGQIRIEKNRHIMLYPYMIHPFSDLKLYWEMFMTLVILLYLFSAPLDISMYMLMPEQISYSPFFKCYHTLMEFCCLADVVLRFFTGYYSKSRRAVVLNPLETILHYLTTSFVPNLFSSVPIHLMADHFRQTDTYFVFFLMVKACTLFYLRRFRDNMNLFSPILRVSTSATKLFCIILFCLLYLRWISSIHSLWYSYIINTYGHNSNYTGLYVNKSMIYYFSITHFECAQQIFLAGTGYIEFEDTAPRMFYYLYVTSLMTLSSILTVLFIVRVKIDLEYLSSSAASYEKMVTHLKAYMHYKRFPQQLQRRVLTYYEFRFQKSYFRESEILHVLCGQLRQDLQVHTCRTLVENVSFFKNIPLTLLVRIVQVLKSEVYLNNDVILKAQTVANCMYFIASGTVGIYSQKGVEICHLYDGNHFGEIALVIPNQMRTATVVSLEICHLYRLDRSDFLKAITPFPDLLANIERIANQRMENTFSRLERLMTHNTRFSGGCVNLILCDNYRCGTDFPLVTDFSEEYCEEGTYYEENYNECFPGCYEADLNTACNPNPCPPGYYCPNDDTTGTERCQIDADSCFKYQIEDSDYYSALWKPGCSSDGTWAARQCKGEATSGRCFCFDAKGNRIFGQAWISEASNMTCACSRKKADLLDAGAWYVSFHCDSMGNYEELQCDVYSGQCWCVEPTTGELTSTVVPESMMIYLPCYNATVMGDQYLRQCESQLYAQAWVEYELGIHGNNYANFGTLLCDDDGSHGAYNISSGQAYCTWRDGSNLGSWQSDTSSGTSGLTCNCARDSKIFSNAGLTQNQQCQGNGNYQAEQQSGDNFYCVDDDGYLKSGYFDSRPTNCSSYY